MENVVINFKNLQRENWSELECKNAELVADFVQNLMNDHNFDYIRKKYGKNNTYIQHNRGIESGLSALVNYVEKFSKKFPDFSYEVKKIIADGDIISFHSHVTPYKKHRGNQSKGLIIPDTWRIENNHIIEHWDAIQPLDFLMRLHLLLVGGKKKNNDNLF